MLDTHIVKTLLPRLIHEGMALPYAHSLLDMAVAMFKEVERLSQGNLDELINWEELFDYLEVEIRHDFIPRSFEPNQLRESNTLDILLQETLSQTASTPERLIARLLEDALLVLRVLVKDEDELDYEIHDSLCHAAHHCFVLSQ
jgi:hypothetical protein